MRCSPGSHPCLEPAPPRPGAGHAPFLLCGTGCAASGEKASSGTASASGDTAEADDSVDREDAGQTTDDPTLAVDFSAFDAELDPIVEEYELDGATVAVVHRDAGLIHERAYGAFEVDRRSLLASSSKVLSAGVLGRLADDGLVDLDAPISTYVGDWGERDHDFDPSLAQILSNSSGMLGIVDNPAYPQYLCMVSERTTLGECGRTIYTASDARVTVAPDTEYRYGGAPWQLAGAIAEQVSGKSWNTLIGDVFLQRLIPLAAAAMDEAESASR